MENPKLEPRILPSLDRYLSTLPSIPLSSLPEAHRSCPICLEPFSPTTTTTTTNTHTAEPNAIETPLSLPCTHIFGSSCLGNWVVSASATSNPTCPLCRAPLQPSSSSGDITRLERAAEQMLREPYTSACGTLRRNSSLVAVTGDEDSAVELVRLFFLVVVKIGKYHRRRGIPASGLLKESATAVAGRMGGLVRLLKGGMGILGVRVPWGEGGPGVGMILDGGQERVCEAAFERLREVERSLRRAS